MSRLEMIRDYITLCTLCRATDNGEGTPEICDLISAYATALGYVDPVEVLSLEDATREAISELKGIFESRILPELSNGPALVKTRFSIVE